MPDSVELQRLVVSMEANFKKWERALGKATGDADKSARKVESRFKRMNRQMSGSFTALSRNLGLVFGAGVLTRGAQAAVDAATRIENALKIAGLEGENLNATYERLYQSAQRNAAPVESLVELYGRAALVQKELGITSEELLGFTDKVAVALRVSGKSAQESSGALLQLSQALGSGVVRAEEFNSILEGALPIAQAAAAGLKEAGGSVANLRKLVIDGKVSSEAFFRAFEAGSAILDEKVAGATFTAAQGFTRIQNAIIDAARSFDDATGVSDTLGRSLNDLAKFIEAVGEYFKDNTTTIREWIDTVSDAWQWLEDFKKSAREFIGLDALDRFLEGTSLVEGTVGFAPEGGASGGPTSRGGPRRGRTATTVSLTDFKPPTGTKPGKEKPFDREIRQIREATEALEVELRLVGETERARDRARAVLELENAARRQGITDIESHRDKINELAEAYSYASENVRNAEDKFEAVNALAREFGSLAQDSIKGLIDGSKSLNDVLADVAGTLADLALNAVLLGEGPLAGFFGTKSPIAGGVGGIFGALFGGFRANGGSVQSGKAYVVGERGPELMVPGQSGTIIPNGNGGGQTSVVNINVDARGATKDAIPGIQKAVGQLARQLEAVQQNAGRLAFSQAAANPGIAR